MFALRQIDREPAVRPAANENCLVLGEGRSLLFSHFSLSFPFLSLSLLPLLFWLSVALIRPFPCLPSLAQEWQPLPTQWWTPSLPLLQRLWALLFLRLGLAGS